MQNQEPEDELTPKERDAFKALRSDKMPDSQLEDKVVAALKTRFLLKKEPGTHQMRSPMQWAIAAVIAVVFLGLGFITGRMTGPETLTSPAAPQFALLVFNDNVTPADEMALANEYGAWMQSIVRSGKLATGEKLHDHGRILRHEDGGLAVSEIDATPANPDRRAALGGFFLIDAADYDEAVRIASTCPHLKYEGTIEVRELHRF